MKLQRYNDWGNIYYAEQGKGLSESGFADARKFSVPMKVGTSVKVTWPDGHHENLPLASKPHSVGS